MKSITLKGALLFAVTLSLNNAVAQDQEAVASGITVPNKSYTAAVDFSDAPKRKTDKYPLSDQSNKGGWVLDKSHSDEFNGDKLNEKLWFPNNPGWKGRQPTYFHDDNVTFKDGYAVFSINEHGKDKLPEGYTHSAGFIRSRDRHHYGYFEARLKPNNSPWVTGFWMSHGDKEWRTEIDICENCPFVEGKEHDLNSNVHVFKAPPEHGDVQKHFSISKKYYVPFRLQDDFHTWGLEWTKEYVRFYLDGVMFREVENTHWHQPLHINFNNESNKWFKALPDDRYVGEKYLVDYFRVWTTK